MADRDSRPPHTPQDGTPDTPANTPPGTPPGAPPNRPPEEPRGEQNVVVDNRSSNVLIWVIVLIVAALAILWMTGVIGGGADPDPAADPVAPIEDVETPVPAPDDPTTPVDPDLDDPVLDEPGIAPDAEDLDGGATEDAEPEDPVAPGEGTEELDGDL